MREAEMIERGFEARECFGGRLAQRLSFLGLS